MPADAKPAPGAPALHPAPPKALRIGRYEIVGELGRGGMGVVYKALDPKIGRSVAIKSILPARLLEAVDLPQFQRRFYREGQAAGKLMHPGIVAIHDLIVDDDQPAIVMEFVEGASLDQLMVRERPPLERCLEIVLEAAEALDYAHRQGVVHRDIKPGNILVTREGGVKITDFGIARLEGSDLTQTGQIVGTPSFMSPEQFLGSKVDGRSDLFSLGSVLYWMCTGQKPFSGKTLSALGAQIVQTEPVPVRKLRPALPPGIEVILSRLLAKDPGGRYATGRDLVGDIMALKAGRPLPQPSGSGPRDGSPVPTEQ